MITLFFATKIECELITKSLSNKSEFSIKGVPFLRGKIKNTDALICISGIGKINSSIAAVLAFEKNPISYAIVSGIAGAYPSSGLKIGDIAVADKEIDADKGVLIQCENKDDAFIFIEQEEISLFVPDFLKGLKTGTFLTVSACTGNIKRANFLERKFNAICENMEGAAIAKAAKIYNVVLSEIRSISNLVTDRTKLLTIDEVKKSAEVSQKFILDNFNLLAELA
ncbi:phosphorylase family protein [Thermodesulfovibrio hydrogeniphilus]